MATPQENTDMETLAKLQSVQQQYATEAAKRFRADGLKQFVELKDAPEDRFQGLAEDPWADHAALNSQNPIQDDTTYKFLILGAGFGGLLFAVRLIERGVATADQIRFLDAAGGFGGTWYWNRYPGLHCDVESYTYLPLLEETGYVPEHKYASGAEIRKHAERITEKWNLTDKALFRATVKSVEWNDEAQTWTAKVVEGRGPREQPRERSVGAQYVLVASGVLTKPQIPRISGLESFQGEFIHTARWNYSVSGGSPEDPTLAGFEGKRVGIIGTGATAIQAVPIVAKYAKELFVFQRTPSSVTWRGQKQTDLEEFKKEIAHKKGWQLERMKNFNSYLTNAAKPEEKNMVADAWTEIPAYCALIGSPAWGIIEPTPEKISHHIQRLMALDLPSTERVRTRVDEIVQDAETADKLKAWYPTWCKRPTFSDSYLQAFNQPNVHLVDTNGKGVSSATGSGLIVDGKEYPVDILILATGYRTPADGAGSPAIRTGIKVLGRNGRSFDEKWENQGATTLHGVVSNGFPNLFFAGPTQSSSAANFVMALDMITSHVAFIIGEAERRVGEGKQAVIEPSVEAEEMHSGEIMRRAAWFGALSPCTPGYLTSEGEFTAGSKDPASMMKAARSGGWTEGMESFMAHLQSWRDSGALQGLEIHAAPVL